MIQEYLAWKAALGEAGWSEDLLHVHVGLVIFVVTALLLRKRMRSWVPLSVVVALAFINEVIDYSEGAVWYFESSAMDFVNSVFWPTLLFLLARRRRRPDDEGAEL